MSIVIARREVEVKQMKEFVPGSVEVLSPEFHPEDENGGAFWKCSYRLDFDDEQLDQYTCGEDSFQALQLALGILPTMIESSSKFRSGDLYLWGEPLRDTDRFFSVQRLGAA